MLYKSKEEILKLGEIDPELDSFLKSTQLPKPEYSNLAEFIQMFKAGEAARLSALGEPPDSVKQTDTTYMTKDGTSLRARLYQPTTSPIAGSPLILMFHGGGFCVGRPETEESTCRNLVQAFGAVCISASYRLAPKFPFPYAISDSWDALKWAAAKAESFGADPSVGFIVGGSSAGGNITAVLAHLARDEKLFPPLTGQYLAIPVVCPQEKMPEKYKDRFLSHEQNKNGPGLGAAAINMFMGAYKPDVDDTVNHTVLLHPKGHGDLPPAYFQVAGMDPLRDEALIYESVLREEYGVGTKIDVYPGMPHGHWEIFPMLQASIAFRNDQVNGFGWLLGKTAKFISQG